MKSLQAFKQFFYEQGVPYQEWEDADTVILTVGQGHFRFEGEEFKGVQHDTRNHFQKKLTTPEVKPPTTVRNPRQGRILRAATTTGRAIIEDEETGNGIVADDSNCFGMREGLFVTFDLLPTATGNFAVNVLERQ